MKFLAKSSLHIAIIITISLSSSSSLLWCHNQSHVALMIITRLRVELEILDELPVVHNYGHCGSVVFYLQALWSICSYLTFRYGVMASPATSEDAVALVKNWINATRGRLWIILDDTLHEKNESDHHATNWTWWWWWWWWSHWGYMLYQLDLMRWCFAGEIPRPCCRLCLAPVGSHW